MSFSLRLMLEWQTMCRKYSRVRNPSFFFSVHNPIKALHRFCLAFLFLFLIQIPFEQPSVNNSTELNWNHFSSARIDSAQCLLQLALITINAGGIQKKGVATGAFLWTRGKVGNLQRHILYKATAITTQYKGPYPTITSLAITIRQSSSQLGRRH